MNTLNITQIRSLRNEANNLEIGRTIVHGGSRLLARDQQRLHPKTHISHVYCTSVYIGYGQTAQSLFFGHARTRRAARVSAKRQAKAYALANV